MRVLDRIEEFIISIGMLSTTILVFLNVVLRAFGSGLSWSEETIRYLLIIVTFIGASVCVREGSHFSVDFILQMIKGRLNQLLMALIYLIAIVFTILLTYYAFEFVNFSKSTSQVSPSIPIPMYYIYLVIPISGVLMCLRYIQCIIGLFLKKQDHDLVDSSAKGDLL